jgi:hypothetical protein
MTKYASKYTGSPPTLSGAALSVNYLKTELDYIYDTATVMGYAKASPIHELLNKDQKRLWIKLRTRLQPIKKEKTTHDNKLMKQLGHSTPTRPGHGHGSV